MSKKLLITVFTIIALAQLYIPASMILRHEQALAHGETYKFRTRVWFIIFMQWRQTVSYRCLVRI